MNREKLENLIKDFNLQKLNDFLWDANFTKDEQDLSFLNNEDIFSDAQKLGEIQTEDKKKIIAVAIKVSSDLSERSGKKKQYDLGKRILMKNEKCDAGIFVFYDDSGSFRFSLIHPTYSGTKMILNNFRRFTYFVSSDPAVTNKTFLKRIGEGDFLTLEKIKEAFSVEKVTKEFFEDIANWYFWAVQSVKFPNDSEEENSKNISVIRLITRLIFIWFMRERGLVPKNLFDNEIITERLKDLSPNESTYYKAILQNLFFATLSTKKEERIFRSETRGHKGINPDRGNDGVFRYRKYFKDAENLQEYFGSIPFLNGGLFECLDDRKNDYYVDGFTESKKDNQPIVPNFLFFGSEQKADLNVAYGTKNKKYKVRGLLDILSSFNFTIDENSPDDVDVALDPELLGRVFENLLASFNPETSTTARKATGSYYTPREIVDYMVAESLKAYFKTHLGEIENIDEKLKNLFARGNEKNPFDEIQSRKLTELIESVKIVDPAVGSGAFPMGALNKLVYILGKIDPDNGFWKQAQLKAADTIPDHSLKAKTKKEIEEYFQTKKPDYWRKLYLIQKCIYGVDIQQIAVEIAKLRFFISLLVDEDKNDIQPLPNLDFKIMQGNSLISEFLGIDFDNVDEKQNKLSAGLSFKQEDDGIIKEFEQKKIDFQNESDKNKKAKLKAEVEDLMIKIFETKVKEQKAGYFRQMKEIEQKYSALPNQKQREEIIVQEKQKLSKKSGFDLDNTEKQLREFTSKKKTRSFFAWRLYFAEVFEKGGFDVVIGNPPYISFGLRGAGEIDLLYKKYLIKHFANSAEYKISLYAIFIELAINLCNSTGNSTYIVPDSFLLGRYFSRIRNFILQKCNIKYLMLIKSRVFKNATVGQSVIYLFQKNNKKDTGMDIILVEDEKQISNKTFIKNSYSQEYFKTIEYNRFRMIFDEKTFDIISKMDSIKNKKFISDVIKFRSGLISKIGQDKIKADYKISDLWRKGIFSGSCVNKFFVNYRGSFLCCDKTVIKSGGIETVNYFEPKLFIRQTGDKIICAFDNNKLLAINNVHIGNKIIENCNMKYIASILNSKLLDFYYKKISLEEGRAMAQIDIEVIEKLPIPEISESDQKPFISLVDQILKKKKDNPKADTGGLEREIDGMVYELYGLSKEEIKIIENSEKK